MKPIVISVGGSLLCPDNIDTTFIAKLKRFILSYVRKGHSFLLVTGGGNFCRQYQKAAQRIRVKNKTSLDWVGIAVTKVNAELLRVAFGSVAYKRVLPNPYQKVKGKVIIVGGYLPGCSTDDDAVIAARTYGAQMLINLSNQDYVFTKDPTRYADAVPLPRMTWAKYLTMINSEWVPGSHIPFDPVAARSAKKMKLKVIFANGRNFRNLHNIINGKKFVGTVLQ